MPSVLLFFLVEFAVFRAGFSQQECQAQVVVTSQAELKAQIRGEIGYAIKTLINASAGEKNECGITREDVNDIKNTLSAISKRLDDIEEKMNLSRIGLSSCHAASSCAEILETNPNATSGYYWVKNVTGHPHSVYCNMSMSCKGVSGGWMRVAYLDMTNSSHQCPSSLRQRTDSDVRSCAPLSDSPTCSSVQHRTHGILYSTVCGRITGYKDNTIDAFLDFSANVKGNTIDSNYVDGVSLTHGETPRQHIWTFAMINMLLCCTNVPAFINNDYFCDGAPQSSTINLANPIWDGEDYTPSSCFHRNNPPWFLKQLPQPTTDDIEMRACRDQERANEDVAIKDYEIYVK